MTAQTNLHIIKLKDNVLKNCMHTHTHLIPHHSHSLHYFLTFLIGMVVANLVAHVLPEVFYSAQEKNVVVLVVIFLILGLALQYYLHHFLSPEKKTSHQFLTALHVHNFTDGITIGLGFLVSIQFGITTLLAILIHDSIHKVIAFSFLVGQGEKRAEAFKKTFLTFLTILVGVFLTFWFKPNQMVTIIGGGLAAGSLAYVAFILLREIFSHDHHKGTAWPKTLYFALGLVAMYFLMSGLERLVVE